ncbi:hypothetical protein M9Y10_029824 [Tritrichomonas musculus]|uniref:ABC transporter domain-containing protein n=1 Tax=Tritrichomonas musculus TaxID=1915356 RepID=A0ABR2KN99_9EUKA
MKKFTRQIKPLAYRHFLILRRTKNIIFRILFPLVICILAVVSLVLALKNQDNLNPEPATFKDFSISKTPHYAIVCKDNIYNSNFVQNLSTEIYNLIEKDTGKKASMVRFNSTDNFDTWVYNIQLEGKPENLLLGVEIGDDFVESKNIPITLLYNSTITGSDVSLTVYFSQLYRALFKVLGLGDLTTRFVKLSQQELDMMMSAFVPFLMICGLTGFLSVIATITTDDVKSPRRQYLITNKVNLSSYWFSTITIDYVIWFVCSIVCWIAVFAIGSSIIKDNIGLTLWAIFFDGFSYLLFVYCVSFIFTNPDTSGAITMLISMLLVCLSLVVDILRGNKGSDFINWFYGVFPPMNFYSMFSTAGKLSMLPVSSSSNSFGSLWTRKETCPLLVFSILNILIWSLILKLIETLRVKIPGWKTRKDFINNQNEFQVQRSRQMQTEEAIQACHEAENAASSGNTNDYSVLVLHVSRLFFNNEKKVIPAVNDVTFGIKKGSMFGFLGSNGAGKTTLMKIITNEIPASSGTIKINSNYGQNGISICPQFNDHLTNEMTPMEHFKIFSQLFEFDSSINTSNFLNTVIQKLELEEHKNKTIKELSGGNARKVAVALALMNPSDIVLFDEPTSSLDPMARHAVHDLMNSYRGQKTFMVCTHLLDEAESLCDNLSIMFHGSIYVVGTPQYLSSKFGTEWKVDILLENDSEEVANRVTHFMTENLPSARISIKRPTNRIYSIPSDEIEIAPLFKLLKKAVEDHVGIKYFTCSSSTLEKVFLELIIQSEEHENEENIVNANESSNLL